MHCCASTIPARPLLPAPSYSILGCSCPTRVSWTMSTACRMRKYAAISSDSQTQVPVLSTYPLWWNSSLNYGTALLILTTLSGDIVYWCSRCFSCWVLECSNSSRSLGFSFWVISPLLTMFLSFDQFFLAELSSLPSIPKIWLNRQLHFSWIYIYCIGCHHHESISKSVPRLPLENIRQ